MTKQMMHREHSLLTILTSVWWYLTVVQVCISQMTSDIEHLFMYLLAIFISSWNFFGMFIQALYPLNWIFLLLNCMSSLYFWITTPYQTYGMQICFHSIGYLFILLMFSFAVQSFLVWCTSNSLFLILLLVL